jgi:hypothetical protein
MKYILTALTVLSLTGCSTLIDSYLMKYDPNEYQQISDIRTTAFYGKSYCDNTEQAKQQAESLSKKTYTFKNYVEYLPHNDKVISASGELDKIAQGLSSQYQKGSVSNAFCKIKFDSIEKSAEVMQKTIGAKPR